RAPVPVKVDTDSVPAEQNNETSAKTNTSPITVPSAADTDIPSPHVRQRPPSAAPPGSSGGRGLVHKTQTTYDGDCGARRIPTGSLWHSAGMRDGVVGVGRVGCGLAGRAFHPPLIQAEPRLRLHAVVTSHADQVRRAAGRGGGAGRGGSRAGVRG